MAAVTRPRRSCSLHTSAGPAEKPVGEVDGVPVLLEASLVDLFDGYEVVIDAGPDPGGDSFSCETELGVRFSMERVPAPR